MAVSALSFSLPRVYVFYEYACVYLSGESEECALGSGVCVYVCAHVWEGGCRVYMYVCGVGRACDV